MAFREVAVTEIREVLRAWLSGAGRAPSRTRGPRAPAGTDREHVRRAVQLPAGRRAYAQHPGRRYLRSRATNCRADALR